MTTRHLATMGIRLLGVAAIAAGLILAASGGIMHILNNRPVESIPATDLHLRDTYYVIVHFEQICFVSAAVSGVTGVFFIIASRRLGALLIRGTES